MAPALHSQKARERVCVVPLFLDVALRSRMQNDEINQDELGPGGNPEALGSASKLFVEAVSPSMRAVEAVIRQLSERELAVLLVGEPGAGKHAAARLVHEMSPRRAESFQAISCVTLTPELLKSSAQVLWGAGTVYLEELAELPRKK